MAADATQHLIDIVAKLTGGDTAVSKLAQLDSTMLAAGRSAAELEHAVDVVSGALTESGAALQSANSALASGEAHYAELETAADRAAKAVERLQASGKSGGAFEARQAEAAEKARLAASALQVEAGALDALRANAAGAAQKHAELSKGLKNLEGAAQHAAKAEAAAAGSGKINEAAEAFGKLGGPVGIAGQKALGFVTGWGKLRASLGAAGIYFAVAAAIVAIATAAIFATAAVTKWAVGLADANRTQTLLAAGVARSVDGGRQLDETIGRLGSVVPQTREELLSMAGDLAKTGLRGKDLTNALEEAAVKAARLKWGPDFAKQMLSLDVQSRRLHENLAGTFGGLKIEGLLSGFQTLVALFDSSTASGRALKFLFEALFQPIVDGVAGAIPSVERLFLHAEILALKAYIALKPYSGAIKFLGEGFAIAGALLLGTLGVAIAAVILPLAGIILGPVVALGLLIAGIIRVAGAIRESFGAAVAFVSELGTQMIQGLVNGITGGATAVVNAMRNVVGSAVDAAKHALGIASPSKVFEGLGGYTAEGFAQGVDGGAGDARGALEAMVAPPRQAGGSSASSGASIGPISIEINVEGAGQSGEGLAAKIADALREQLEGLVRQVGGGEVPA